LVSGPGFWISPDGQIYRVETSHIAYVIKHPEKFELSKTAILDTYSKHDEPLGLEGNARTEIIKSLVNSGWIRIRLYLNKNGSITVWELRAREIIHLKVFARNILASGIDGFREPDMFNPVCIFPLRSGKIQLKYTISELAESTFSC